ncbi:hypothetical protein EVG20_g828 [Dentipellis fragilis]|uniref:DNA-directed RNA polymerase III subunit RPC9 n=1 Tax=Dentipellis fragilis TaxID=205917 RepID=A0A4Y9ZBJ6_9AGAM|nr:hypothetical protein EVG20_g828 [Dentipellis fragilis]
MEVINSRASLLSNYEVLTLLRDLESDYIAKSKTSVRIKKEEDAAGPSAPKAYDPLEDISENLRTMEVEAIQYLSAEYQPMRAQMPAGITMLVKSLAPYGLNKSEKLQIVNLAPTEPVELYVIVEELEDRLGEKLEDVLTSVRTSLAKEPAAAQQPVSVVAEMEVYQEQVYDEDGQWEQDANDVEFVDAGEGAGIEGDLDVDDE